MSVNEKMTAIADAIREKTGGTEALTLDDMALAVSEVFEGGKRAEYDAFWDAHQDNGNRVNYDYGFYRWSAKNFYPKHDMTNMNGCLHMFRFFNQNRTSVDKTFDFTQRLKDCNVTLNFKGCQNLSFLFYYVRSISLPEIDASTGTNLASMFAYSSIPTIEKLILNPDGTQEFTNVFQWAEDLENIEIEGCIGNNIDFKSCSKLTTESLRSILRALSTNGSGKAITFATASQAIIESDTECIQYATAAKSAGWTFAYN